MMNELHDLCDTLKEEIRELNKKGDISPTELERAYKAVDIIKDIKTIEAMEEAGSSYEDGHSNRMYYPYAYDEPGVSTRRDDSSYRRGRDMQGRYVSRDEMSRDNEKEQMLKTIEQMKQKLERM